jgi:8-oxo-dGTP pyrophosphatase MutT (NUDIX family)
LYLVLHSATVRNPRAKWEFPKGGVEPGEATHQTASREFQEETGLQDWSFVEGFERSLSYTYIRRGRLYHTKIRQVFAEADAWLRQ